MMVKARIPAGYIFTAGTVLMLVIMLALAGIDAAVSDLEKSNFTIISGMANIEGAKAATDLEKLKMAAKTDENDIVDITLSNNSSRLVFAQERVTINIDCLPWLQRIQQNQNGAFKIEWSFVQLTKDGQPTMSMNPKTLPPTPPDRLGLHRIVVGGESNRWLNITQTVVVPGAEDPDNKVFNCTVIKPTGERYESPLILLMVGAPPVITRGNGSEPVSTRGNIKSYDIGTQICISRDDHVTVTLRCQVPYGPPLFFPNPNRTWTKDGILIYSTEHGKNPDLTTYVNGRTLLMPGSLHPTPLTATKDGSIVLNTKVNRILSPSVFKQGYDINKARVEVFELLLGTWSCAVNNSYGTDVVTTVITDCDSPVLSAPYEVQGYCSHINWRSSSDVLCQDISGYDVRLFNPTTGEEVVRRVGTHGTFYNLLAIDKHLKNETTLFQVRVVSSSLFHVGPYTTAANLGCPQPEEQPTIAPPIVYFELNGQTFHNNTVINFLDIGEGESALFCKTNKAKCCHSVPNRYGDFYYPNGLKVPVIGLAGEVELYRNRGNQLIRLNRRAGVVSPRGKYRCEIPDDSDVMQNIIITLN